jgi:hypothetical protein
MTIDQLVADLAQNQVVVFRDGDRFRYRVPEGELNTDLRAAIGDHRDALVEQLRRKTSDHCETSKCITCIGHIRNGGKTLCSCWRQTLYGVPPFS